LQRPGEKFLFLSLLPVISIQNFIPGQPQDFVIQRFLAGLTEMNGHFIDCSIYPFPYDKGRGLAWLRSLAWIALLHLL
jgi:hypothetical protein